jgi:hypothetical protein
MGCTRSSTAQAEAQLCLSLLRYVSCILKISLRLFAPSRVPRVWTTEPASLHSDTERRVKSINYCIKHEIMESKTINLPLCSTNTTRKRHVFQWVWSSTCFRVDASGKPVASFVALALYSRGKPDGTHQIGPLLEPSESLLSLPRLQVRLLGRWACSQVTISTERSRPQK